MIMMFVSRSLIVSKLLFTYNYICYQLLFYLTLFTHLERI